MRRSNLIVLLGLVGAALVYGSCADSSSPEQGCDAAEPCSGHGTCDDSSGTAECTCDPGYTGTDCADCADDFVPLGGGLCGPSVPCEGPSPCNGNGTCDDSSGVAECTCDPGYTGTDCADCESGYVDYGDGECRPLDPCTTDPHCANLHRECTDDGQGHALCGDCLVGYSEINELCIPTCAAESNPGVLVPLDLFIMLDRSASMTVDNKWTAVTSALQSFVTAADASGIGVGLQYFPLAPSTPIPTDCDVDADCGLYGPCLPQQQGTCAGSQAPDTSCEIQDYSAPEVAIATLPGNAGTLSSSLSAATPDGLATPSQPAMAGAVAYATDWAQSHPNHLVFIVFATDGEPTGCVDSNSIQGTADLAQAAATGTPPVPTFVIGVGTELTSLNQIAVAGGTSQAYLVDTGGNVTQQFIDALNAVRATGDCRYQIPQPDQGTPNYNMINVQLVDPAHPDQPTLVVNVGDESGCDPVTGGWYYDDPSGPEMILLCEASCDALSLGTRTVDILVGCETIVN